MFIRVQVAPGARRDKVERRSSSLYSISTKAEAEGNDANNRVIELMAEELGIPPRSIRIMTGHRSTSKMLKVADREEDTGNRDVGRGRGLP